MLRRFEDRCKQVEPSLDRGDGKTCLELQEMAVAELRAVAGCEGGGVTINPQTGWHATWTLTTFNPGQCEPKLCGDVLVAIVSRMQHQYDFVEDPARPMPRRL